MRIHVDLEDGTIGAFNTYTATRLFQNAEPCIIYKTPTGRFVEYCNGIAGLMSESDVIELIRKYPNGATVEGLKLAGKTLVEI